MNPFIVLENRKSDSADKSAFYFTDPIEEIVCTDPVLLEICLDKIDEMRRRGYYLVGFISYEASYFLYPFPVPGYVYQDDFPLLHFYVFNNKKTALDWVEARDCVPSQKKMVSDIELSVTEAEYQSGFDTIKKHIIDGNTYQVNYTAKYHFQLQGDPIQLYQALCERQKVEYAALFYFKDYQILSLSPELFFSKRGDTVTVKPMKGTMPRSVDQECDEKNKMMLTSDPKSIAENIMIVDLLRNDLSKIAIPGSLRVVDLLHVDSFKTVHQMVSTIQAEVEVDTPFKVFIKELFPCGSITGVPKKRTMQIIHALEKKPRRIYTGVIGYIAPNNDMCFSVAIRTLLIRNTQGELGVGGGIVSDSIAEQELEELKLKAHFFTGMA